MTYAIGPHEKRLLQGYASLPDCVVTHSIPRVYCLMSQAVLLSACHHMRPQQSVKALLLLHYHHYCCC